MSHLRRPNDASGNGATAADSVATSFTGNIDVRLRVALDDWSPSAEKFLFCKGSGASGNRCWRLTLNTGGALRFKWSPAGTTETVATSTVVVGLSDAEVSWLRFTLDVDNGASGYDAKFWLADGALVSPAADDFVQLGSTVTGLSTTTLFDSAVGLAIGGLDPTLVLGAAGDYYRAQLRSDLTDGDPVFDADFSDESTWAQELGSITEKANDATVTLQGDAELVSTAPPFGSAQKLLLLGVG